MEKSYTRSPLERRMEIIETTIRSRGPVRTRELAERFGIKQNLLAHDVNALVDLGLVERGHGWVAARSAGRQGMFAGTEFAARQSRNQQAKRAIASYIADRLRHAEDVVLDAGSTSLAIVDQLARNEQTLDVFTNNLAILLRLAETPSVTCHLVGGDYSPQQAATTGSDAATAIEGRIFGAGVLTPRAIAVIPPGVAQAEQLPSGAAARVALSRVAGHQGTDTMDVARRSLFLSIYSADGSQKPVKSVLIKNSAQLLIAADHTKLFAGGEPFFTIILPSLLRTEGIKEAAPIEQSPARRSSVAPVRSRGAVRMRRILSQTAAQGDHRTHGTWDDINVDASVDVRDPGSTILVTSTDNHDEVPPELKRQLLALSSEECFEDIMEVARSTIVVVNRSGEPVPLDLR